MIQIILAALLILLFSAVAEARPDNETVYELVVPASAKFTRTYAQQQCSNRGGWLATVANRSRWDLLLATPRLNNYVEKSMLIGGQKVVLGNRWEWSGGPLAGEDFYDASTGNCLMFCEWLTGEPNNLNNDNEQDVALYRKFSSDPYKMVDVNPNSFSLDGARGYLCEYPRAARNATSFRALRPKDAGTSGPTTFWKEVCETSGGWLATPSSQELWLQLLEAINNVSDWNSSALWAIGAANPGKNSTFRWVDGPLGDGNGGIGTDFTVGAACTRPPCLWGPGQPISTGSEAFVKNFTSTNSFLWAAATGALAEGAICQYDWTGKSITEGVVSANNGSAAAKTWYEAVLVQTSAEEARMACIDRGGWLATIGSQAAWERAERTILMAVAALNDTTGTVDGISSLWLGGSRSDNAWQWKNGSLAGDSLTQTFMLQASEGGAIVSLGFTEPLLNNNVVWGVSATAALVASWNVSDQSEKRSVWWSAANSSGSMRLPGFVCELPYPSATPTSSPSVASTPSISVSAGSFTSSKSAIPSQTPSEASVSESRSLTNQATETKAVPTTMAPTTAVPTTDTPTTAPTTAEPTTAAPTEVPPTTTAAPPPATTEAPTPLPPAPVPPPPPTVTHEASTSATKSLEPTVSQERTATYVAAQEPARKPSDAAEASPVVSGVAIGVNTIAIMTGSPNGGLMTSRARALSRNTRCTDGTEDVELPFPANVFHPELVPPLDAAIVGMWAPLVSWIVLLALHAIAALVTWRVGGFRMLIALGKAKFPSHTLAVGVLIVQDAARSALVVARVADSTGLRAAGWIMYLGWLTVVPVLLWRLWESRFHSKFDPREDEDKEMLTRMEKLERFCCGHGTWKDTTCREGAHGKFTRRWAALFDCYNGVWRRFMIIEVGVSLVFATIEGLWPADQPNHLLLTPCEEHHGTILHLVVAIVLVGLLGYARPFHAPLEMFLVASGALLQVMGDVFIIADVNETATDTCATLMMLAALIPLCLPVIFRVLLAVERGGCSGQTLLQLCRFKRVAQWEVELEEELEVHLVSCPSTTATMRPEEPRQAAAGGGGTSVLPMPSFAAGPSHLGQPRTSNSPSLSPKENSLHVGAHGGSIDSVLAGPGRSVSVDALRLGGSWDSGDSLLDPATHGGTKAPSAAAVAHVAKFGEQARLFNEIRSGLDEGRAQHPLTTDVADKLKQAHTQQAVADVTKGESSLVWTNSAGTYSHQDRGGQSSSDLSLSLDDEGAVPTTRASQEHVYELDDFDLKEEDAADL